MNQMKRNVLLAALIVTALILSLGTMGFAPLRFATALPLPGGRSWDQVHDLGMLDWNGPVQYEYVTHRDNTSTSPEEGSVFCGGGCDEWVTRLDDGGSVSGAFSGNVTNFKVLVAASHDGAVGTALLQACSASASMNMYIGPGRGLPGFIGFDLDVPAGCPGWTLRASGGYVLFHSVNADYTSVFATNTPVPPTFTPLPSATFTVAPTLTSTSIPTDTPTATPTFTPTQTPSPTPTFTWTPSPTSTFTPTATATPLPPVITLASILCDRWGTNGWCVENARLAITASDPQGFPLTITGTAGQPFTCGADCVVFLPEGMGTAQFTVTASSGRAVSGSLDWKYDASLPTSDLQLNGTSGANGWYVSAVTVNALGTDAVSGVASQEVSVDGGAWQSSATLSDGTYQVQARSVDNAGWETWSAVQTIKVDTLQPELAMTPTGTQGGGGYFRSAVTVSLVGTDLGSGLALVEYRLDGGEWVSADHLTISTDGDHGLEWRVTDNAGNLTTTVTVVHIDTIPPVATFIMPPPDSTTRVQEAISLGGNVFDVGSGVEHVELSLDEGKTWKMLPLVNEIWRYDWVTLGIPNGTYRVTARAWDLAGNMQTPGTSITLIVDNRPPFIAVQEHWFVWESGWLHVDEKDGMPLENVRITIRDPQGRWPEAFWNYAPDKVPETVSWDGRFADGILAPVGEYEVIAEARDVYGHRASDRGVIVVPFVSAATATLTPIVMVTPSPTSTITAVPTRHIVPTKTAIATTVPMEIPVPQPVQAPVKRSLMLWPAVGLIGLLMALASASLTDHRPQALRRIKETFDQIVAQNKLDDGE